MSLDLVLYFLSGPDALLNRSVPCCDQLRFDQDYRIFGQIKDLSSYSRSDIPAKPTIKVNPVPRLLLIFHEEDGSRRIRSDMYGELLTYAYAKDLRELEMPADSSPRNKAIKAFVDALPENTPIILFWG